MDQLGRLHRSNILDRMSDQLAVITCLSLGLFDDMTNAHVLGQLARKHWSSLLRLELGIERNLVGQYALPAIYKVEQHKEASQQFLVGLGDLKSPSTAFNLTSLRLCGLCLDGDHLGDFATTVIANNLKTLSLESCSGSGVFLANLVRYFSSSGEVSTQETAHKTIKLRSFTLRHELPTAVMISSFEKFVDSFCGLEELFVLLDQTDKMPHPRCFLKKHGLTLKKLVWEGRTAPRQNMEHDTSIFTEQLNCSSKLGEDISSSCRSLAELGIALEWDSMVSDGVWLTGRRPLTVVAELLWPGKTAPFAYPEYP